MAFSFDGDFIKNFPLPDGIIPQGLELINNEFFLPQYISRGRAENNWVIIDTLGNIQSKMLNAIPSFNSNLGAGGGIYKFKNNISYWNRYCDTVYTIQPDFSYSASIVFSQGDHRFPRQDPEFDEQLKYFRVLDIFETNNFFVVKYIYNYMASVAFVDKTTRDVQFSQNTWDLKGIKNDLDAGLVFHPETYYTNDNGEYLVGIVHAYQLKFHIASATFKNTIPKFPEKKNELEKLAASLDKNDNMVLVLVKLMQ